MSVQLSVLRQKVYTLLREDNPKVVVTNPNTHFTDYTVIDGFLNEALEYSAVFIEYPRKLYTVAVTAGQADYTNPTDNLLIRTAYFGNSTTVGDLRRVQIVTEETLREFYPGWMENTLASRGDYPQFLIQKTRSTMTIFPTPNAVAVTAGRSLILNYEYIPVPMSADSDIPDLPTPYHNLLPFYALHLAYISLGNVPLAAEMYKEFMEKVNRIKSAVTKESKDNLGFSWGNDVSVNVGVDNLVNP